MNAASAEIDDRKGPRQARQKRVLARELRDRDILLSLVAHDLRNPFSVLISGAGFLAEHCADLPHEELVSLLKGLKRQAEKSHQLCEELLTWSKGRSGTLVPILEDLALDPLIDRILASQADSARSRSILISRRGASGLSAFSDRWMLEACLRNLLANAVKFSPRGGTVRVCVSPSAEDVVIEVRDSGPGLSEAEIELLFRSEVEPSRITAGGSAKGTGLGLILCHDFMRRLGASIEASSRPGEGATFSIRIPTGRSLSSSSVPRTR